MPRICWGGILKLCFFVFTELQRIAAHNQRAGESHARAVTMIRSAIRRLPGASGVPGDVGADESQTGSRSEEHTSELQSPDHLVCRLLLEKKKHNNKPIHPTLRLAAPTD